MSNVLNPFVLRIEGLKKKKKIQMKIIYVKSNDNIDAHLIFQNKNRHTFVRVLHNPTHSRITLLSDFPLNLCTYILFEVFRITNLFSLRIPFIYTTSVS